MTPATQDSGFTWEQRPWRELVRLAVPTALSSLSYSLMTLMDTLFVSRLGADSLAGVALGGTASFVLLSFWFGAFRATKTLVAQARGAGREHDASTQAGLGVLTALLAGVASILLGHGVASLLPRLSGSVEAGQHAAQYLRTVSFGAPMVLLTVALGEVRLGSGDAVTPLRAAFVGNALNLILAWLLIFRAGLGVTGAALATVIANTVETAWLARVQARAGLAFRALRREHFSQFLRLGLPSGVQALLELGAYGLMAAMIAPLGAAPLAAHQLVSQLLRFLGLPVIAIAESAAVMAGQAVGAGRLALVRRVTSRAFALTGTITLGVALTLALGSSALAAAASNDVPVRELAFQLLWLGAAVQVAGGANAVATGVLRGTGDATVPALSGIVTAWLGAPLLMWLLGYRLGWGVAGGWLGLLIENVACASFLGFRLWSGGWRRAPTRVTSAPAA
ncbi:MATE family efflux transporter [Pyxidicoccus sp. MSG2]|uniref:MATE family efflux transporter n=1 Tax=Pyxidicoccus sp. MSG2 TaxID=2996790 RepID=UPI00226E68DD|nr:MATE family efflux transporter [Pyxidicoccus sp. MSG2]MCY1021697.1 MATE family efflux transporter [Pyxidicoccus sp. MSG2]